MSFEKVNLFKTRAGLDLREKNEKDFDKTIMEYKKHFLCLTKNEIIAIGYKPVKKESEISKIYHKKYDISEIDEVIFDYSTQKYTTRGTSYRTVTNEYGRKFTEEIKEDVPYEVENSTDVIWFGVICFKNMAFLYFNFSNLKKSLKIANKFMKTCSKLGIPYKLQEEKE